MSNRVRVTTQAVKLKIVDTCIQWLIMAGCQVSDTRDADTVTLCITIPPDSTDPHGDRLRAAREYEQTA